MNANDVNDAKFININAPNDDGEFNELMLSIPM